ncbi:MAG: hypothetical protein NTW79_02555 [Candidatus Berkelbacteria bacterium]|nr:hypothetical protein [Candidatus Berkelbacteria bacterium]
MYEHSIAEIRRQIFEIKPDAIPVDHSEELNRGGNLDLFKMFSYLLFMCNRLETMIAPDQASRWIGWIYSKMETYFPSKWKLENIRDYARADAPEVKQQTIHWVQSQTS